MGLVELLNKAIIQRQKVAATPGELCKSQDNLFSLAKNKYEDGTATNDLLWWLNQVEQCTSQEEILSLLSKFRPLPWTYEQRSVMSRRYIPILERLSQLIQPER